MFVLRNPAGLCVGILFLLLFLTGPGGIAVADYFEQPGSYSTGAVLSPKMIKGRYHQVHDRVEYDGFLYHFTVQSQFGTFNVASITSLAILIHELEAIAAMKEVETTDTFVKAMQQSGENTITGIKNLISEPEDSLWGAGQGISSLFSRATETIGSRELTATEDSRMEQLLGVTKSKGAIASRYEVSVYSANKVLQEELDRLAMADYLGGIGVGLATSAVPGVGGLVLSTSGTARLLNETINTASPTDLWLQNKNKLLAMGINTDTIELFLNNPVFTPSLQTVVVTALEKMRKAANRELFIKVGLQASTPDMARVISETAVMAAGYSTHIAPLKVFSPMARLLKAKKADGTIVVFLPTDHLIWTKRAASVTAEIVRNGMSNNVAWFEIWTLGTFSEQARSSLKSMGWRLHEQARKDLAAKP